MGRRSERSSDLTASNLKADLGDCQSGDESPKFLGGSVGQINDPCCRDATVVERHVMVMRPLRRLVTRTECRMGKGAMGRRSGCQDGISPLACGFRKKPAAVQAGLAGGSTCLTLTAGKAQATVCGNHRTDDRLKVRLV